MLQAEQLPTDVWLLIAEYCCKKEIFRVRILCTQTRALCSESNHTFWSNLLSRDKIEPDAKMTPYKQYLEYCCYDICVLPFVRAPKDELPEVAEHKKVSICNSSSGYKSVTTKVMEWLMTGEYPRVDSYTIGADFMVMPLLKQDRAIKLLIWSCGDDRSKFRSISSAYYRDASIVVLVFSTVYDIDTDKLHTFEHAFREAIDVGERGFANEDAPFIMCGINHMVYGRGEHAWSEEDKRSAKKQCDENGFELMWLDCTKNNSINQLMKRIVQHLKEDPKEENIVVPEQEKSQCCLI